MSKVRRVYVEKKDPYAVKARELKHEISSYLGIKTVTGVRVLVRYDVEDISEETYRQALVTVFSEPPVDTLYEETFPYNEADDHVFSVEYLPGQFDQRADSAVQCVKFLKEDEEPVIKSATTYIIEGSITEEEFESIKSFSINPVDSRETGLEKPETLVTEFEEPADVKIFDGFKDMAENALKELYDSLGLAMTFKDFLHIQNYFREDERRDPSMTEIRVLDTYWSDHCRHTTFNTELTDVTFEDGYYKTPILKTYERYMEDREVIFKGREDKFVCLMDLALMAMRKLKKEGKLEDQEESDEINACSIVVPVEIDKEDGNGVLTEEWLVNFKNETHNHPTEIEPFGGAATCLGGAIRDPLSGRTYVYQAMRVTGAADPTVSVKDTMKGKLPQKKLVRGAANGYSSYGNQIGLATGLVKEIYHPDYVAKRMEIGAVIAAAPRYAVKRENSDPGDIIILLGGRTGRDGCGGATGSSKVHTESSIETCGAEVQKGNAPTERKLQRLFRREEVSRLIKKCNDFGAGGVSVAIGELADGLDINLDRVTKKYAGLDGTEIAISESQERMAVVVDKKDVAEFMKYANEENLEATEVAVVTEEPRLVLKWRGKEIVNIKRSFLDTNGAHQENAVRVNMPDETQKFFETETVADVKKQWLDTLADLNVCSQKGLVERFDGSIGAGSVFMPFGGRYQLTETQAMVAKLPVLKGKCDTVTMMSYGFDPYLSTWSPYHSAIYAVTESVAKIVASGGDYKKIRFTFQEYFRRMTSEPERWSQPFAALLGAYDAQLGFGLSKINREGIDAIREAIRELERAGYVTRTRVRNEKGQLGAIILDGNGRWAKAKGMPRNYGHVQGAKNVERICEDAYHMGIKYLTVYAFSTENWRRSKDEVDALMSLLRSYMKTCVKTAKKNHMRVRVIGDKTGLAQDIQDSIANLERESKDQDGLNFTIAINYGSRDEIRRGVQKIIKEGIRPEEVTEEVISDHLDTAGIPDPDLLIRTSGELRLSNYLMWQLAYAEFYFTDVPWPDFDKGELEKAIEKYNQRDRRYGGVKEELKGES